MNTRRRVAARPIRSACAGVLATVAVVSATVLSSCARGEDAGSAASSASAGSTVSAPPVTSTTAAEGVDATVTACAGTVSSGNPDSVRRSAARTLAVGVSGFDDAAAAVDAGVRHLFIGSGTDRSLLDGQGDPARSLAELQRRASASDGRDPGDGPAVTVSVDEEGGQVQRLADLTGTLPSAREAAATMSPEEVTELFADHARRMRELGITMDFAPDVDLDGGGSVSDNAIGDRAYSADPEVVVRYGRAVIEGLTAGGVTPVIKHFPGHGHATGDSHTGTVSTPPVDQLGADLRPFGELSGIPGVAVMVGHLQVPGLDAPEAGITGADTPASLNPAAYALLRAGVDGNPGFSGQVFTDDLTGMRAVTDRWTPGDAVVTALKAGADAPLVSSGMDAAALPGVLEAVVSAVADGTLPMVRLVESLDRSCPTGAVSGPVTR